VPSMIVNNFENPSHVLFFFMIVFLDSDAAQEALLEGEKQLAVLTRQTVMSRLYPSAASVMEAPTAVGK
jgi:hypothetical protein